MEPQRYNHLNIVKMNDMLDYNKLTSIAFIKLIYQPGIWKESFGLLVLLGYDITAFTPVAYQGHSL